MMKRLITLICIFSSIQLTAQTGIGTTTPNAAAKLDVSSTEKGLLIPRMTKSQREAITLSAAANGLLVYQTDDLAGFYVNTSTNTTVAWTRVNTDWTRTTNNINYSLGNVGIGTVTPAEKLDVNGNVKATNFIGSGSQLTEVATRVTGSWTLNPGANDVSFNVAGGGTYSMWVNGNIPNGIALWTATVTTANTNVPVLGSQYAWYYTAGNALVWTSIPDQITGTNNTIVSSPAAYAPNTSNVFKFRITNNSATSQTIYWGYIKL
jgi:hypothetical protein